LQETTRRLVPSKRKERVICERKEVKYLKLTLYNKIHAKLFQFIGKKVKKSRLWLNLP
jgi:hypothetical protein